MRLGQSTLTDDEKRTEAKKHLTYLSDFLESMNQTERNFVERKLQAFEDYDDKTRVSNSELFWLRDLVVKY